MKLHIVLLWLSALVILMLPAQAKGPSDRIILTSPMLETPIILTEPEIIGRLSFGTFEDFMAGAVAEPADLTENYYELERQFETSKDKFSTFDKVRFYPDTGLVNYLGIVNGWSDYDNNWYPVRPEAAVAFQTIFDSSAHPYLILMQNDGIVRFVDPVTLEDAAQVGVFDYPMPLISAVDGPDTHTLYVSGEQARFMQHYRMDLREGTLCQVDVAPFSTAQASGMLWVAGAMADDLSAGMKGTWLEPVDLMGDGLVLLHHPLGRYHHYDYGAEDRGEIPGGVLVYSQVSNRRVDQWQPDIGFAQVIAGGTLLYGVHAPRGGDRVELYALDGQTGEIMASRGLEDAVWHVGYAVLDLSRMKTWSEVSWLDTCRLSEWEVPQMFRFTWRALNAGA